MGVGSLAKGSSLLRHDAKGPSFIIRRGAKRALFVSIVCVSSTNAVGYTATGRERRLLISKRELGYDLRTWYAELHTTIHDEGSGVGVHPYLHRVESLVVPLVLVGSLLCLRHGLAFGVDEISLAIRAKSITTS